jgi:hypothetical protein
MKARSLKRLTLLGIAAGMVAAVGLPVAFTGGSVGDLVLAARSTDTSPTGAFRKFPRPGPPIVVRPDDGAEAGPAPGRTPVGADRKDPPGPPVVVKPGGGQTAAPVPQPDPEDTSTPLPAEPLPGGGIGGRSSLRHVTATSAVSAAPEKAAVATCPSGTRIYGGGGRITSPGQAEGRNGTLMLESLRPTTAGNGLDSFVVTAKRRPVEGAAPAISDWSVQAFAVCGRALPGYERVVAGDGDLDRQVTATAVCPTDKRVIGMGGAVSDPFDMFSFDRMIPDAAGTSVTVTGVDDSTDGVRAAFRVVQAIAVCAFPPDGYKVTSRGTFLDQGFSLDVDSECPDGTTAYSAGFSKQDGDTGHVLIDEAFMRPASSADKLPGLVEVTAKNASDPENSLRAAAICGT